MDNLNDILNIDINTGSKFFKKGHILQYEGDITSRAFYVKKGLLRSYTIDEKGKEHIFMFAPEGWLTADVESQEFDHPAMLFIECIEDSEIIIIDRKKLELSTLTSQQLNKHVSLLHRRIGMLQHRLIMMMSAPALKRYETFLETYPELPQRVPQRMIASYLGITPQALSTIRKGISLKK